MSSTDATSESSTLITVTTMVSVGSLAMLRCSGDLTTTSATTAMSITMSGSMMMPSAMHKMPYTFR